MRFHRPAPITSRPRVSVVIPCYRYGHYLPGAVASALDQDMLDVDVLVVDDASPDDSALVARELAARDPRVDVLVHEQNAGHIQTYNDGLAKASGDYVVLLSADDLLPPNSLTRAVALMEAHPRVGLVYGFARSFTDAPEPVDDVTRSWTVWQGHDWLSRSARAGRCFLSSPEAVMRREALFETDLYDPRLPHSGDFDMWLRTAARWDVGRVNGPIQAHYRVHDANMHLTTYAGWLTDLEARRLTFDILFDERAPGDPRVAALRPTAKRALAREALRRARHVARDEAAMDVADDYVRFALETWPSITGSSAWHATRVSLAGGNHRRAGTVRRQASRVRDHLVWRRERRWGV
ncbi:glycosyltransferase family 2 protein [Nocardioides hwasunensis]|uniref:Glycosyltransferase family 2 protein n=1 Tax=Nocardioides hwasunensis TaxID=397258 RepID=A0ABR8MGN2_9ACTN|nr:glycosyltransferase family 2 protein [Nocardioides hwasunensis]MBD3915234.1 glycosyltransferase family 2 protein [Nocardioides hwasunensis]